jgi:thimet oligopeptidase
MQAAPLSKQVRDAIQRTREGVETFMALPEETPFDEVVKAFDGVARSLNGPAGRVGLFAHTHPDAAVREECETLEQEIAALSTELSLHRGLYERLAQLDPDGDNGTTDREARRRHAHALRDFRRSGVDRDEATRERVRALQEELVKVGQDFDRNIVMGGKTYVVEGGAAGLAGLPADFIETHPPREDGAIEVSTDPSDRMVILTFAEDEALRRDYYTLSLQRAVPENLEVLPKLLALRHELAGLLGYPDWATYVTEDKMARTTDSVRDFLGRVVELVRPRAQREYDELLAKKRELDASAADVHEWDRMFLTERVKAERHGVDAQQIRPYFAYERVKQGLLATSARLYGVEFKKDETAQLWHPSIERYEIVDDGRTIASFFLDMHPREGKYKHAAMFHLCEGMLEGELAEAALVCNFPEPSADDPALLLHDQVTTFFHEFGHLLHHLFGGQQRFLAFSGIATEMDFVEVPSQAYEEWAWNADVLATFATHVETDEPLPAALVQRMRDADEYGKGLNVMQQMFYALLSLTYYDRDPAGQDLEATMLRLKSELLPVPHTPDTSFHASFGHLHGYSAMYYTYMWSLVIAKDLFSRFEADPMDAGVAREYRATVLAPGGSKDAAELVSDFLGREYSFDAFERWLTQ